MSDAVTEYQTTEKTLAEVADEFDVSTSALHRAYTRRMEGGQAQPGAGRPSRLTKEGCAELQRIVNDRSDRSKTLSDSEFADIVWKMEKDRAREQGENVHSVGRDLAFAKRLIAKHFVSLKTGSVQSRSRIKAIGDVANFVSVIAMLRNMLHDDAISLMGPVPHDRIYCLDSTSLLLQQDAKGTLRLVTTPASQQSMADKRRDVAAEGGAGSVYFRVPSYFLTSASGELALSVFLIKDPSIEKDTFKRFEAPSLNSSGGGLCGRKSFIYLIPAEYSNFDEKAWLKAFFTELVVPAIAINAPPEATGQRPRSALFLDGDIPQVQVLETEEMQQQFNAKSIQIGKIPAATSWAMQANDMMRAHAILKRFGKNLDNFEVSADTKGVGKPLYYDALIQWFEKEANFTRGKQQLIETFFYHGPSILAKSFSVAVVKSGWKTIGFAPFDEEVIMNLCSGWKDLSYEKSEQIWNAIEPLTIHFATDDWTTEEILTQYGVPTVPEEEEALLETVNEPRREKHEKLMTKNEMVTWRQRAVCLTGRAFIQRCRQKVIDVEVAEAARVQAATEKLAEKEKKDADKLAAKKQKEVEAAIKAEQKQAAAEALKRQQAQAAAAAAEAAAFRKQEIAAQAKAFHEQQLKEAAELAATEIANMKKRKAELSTCHNCNAQYPVYDKNVQLKWKECKSKQCQKLFCPNADCQQTRQLHENVCPFASAKKAK